MRSLIICLTLGCVFSSISIAQKKAASEKTSRTASFPGGQEAMIQYMNQNIRYPEQSIESGIEGQVTLRAVINESGHVEQITVLRGIGGGCDSEAVRVIKGMPAWQPALYHGKPVKSVLAIPVRFALE